MKKTPKSKAFFVFLLMAGATGSYAQTTPTNFKNIEEKQAWQAKNQPQATTPQTDGNGLPAGFPTLQNTGNPEQDQANYQAAKKQWVANNPQAYQAALGKQPVAIAQEDFDKLPAEKQAIIKANPDLYIVGALSTKPVLYPIAQSDFDRMPAEKQAMIKANPDKYVIEKDAANPSKSGKIQVRYEELKSMPADKAAHIKANPDLYEIID